MKLFVCIYLIFNIFFVIAEDWDHFVFTTTWPQALCLKENSTHSQSNEICKIPSNINFWVVHGLWPTKGTTETPNYCKNAPKFNETLIESIKPKLQLHWPNLFVDTKESDFWEHEWTKHGTCSIDLPSLGDELKYFTKVLDILSNLKLDKHLSDNKITPSLDIAYDLNTLTQAIKTYTKFFPRFYCLDKKDSKNQYLFQMELCLNKSFNYMKCPHHKEQHEIEQLTNKLEYLKNQLKTSFKDFPITDLKLKTHTKIDPLPYLKQFTIQLLLLQHLSQLTDHKNNNKKNINNIIKNINNNNNQNGNFIFSKISSHHHWNVNICNSKPIIYLPITHSNMPVSSPFM